jgi:hypothetical protein
MGNLVIEKLKSQPLRFKIADQTERPQSQVRIYPITNLPNYQILSAPFTRQPALKRFHNQALRRNRHRLSTAC